MTEVSTTIVLVGLMGAGKTSVGRRLAEMLALPFYDSDDEVVAAAGMSITEIFERYGEDEFRRGETAVLARLIEAGPSVLSTGGGAFISQENRALISGRAVSVWLDVPLKILWGRVNDKPGRPLLATDDPFGTLKKLHEERSPVYALADCRVTSSAKDAHDDVARSIIAAVSDFTKQKAHQSETRQGDGNE